MLFTVCILRIPKIYILNIHFITIFAHDSIIKFIICFIMYIIVRSYIVVFGYYFPPTTESVRRIENIIMMILFIIITLRIIILIIFLIFLFCVFFICIYIYIIVIIIRLRSNYMFRLSLVNFGVEYFIIRWVFIYKCLKLLLTLIFIYIYIIKWCYFFLTLIILKSFVCLFILYD